MNNIRFGYIYKITNKLNNKVYIGQTKREPKLRFAEHCSEKRDANSGVHYAIQKYGKENFIFEVIEKLPVDDLNDREQYWIKYYQSTKNDYGYNRTIGGDEVVYQIWKRIKVKENNLIFDSRQELGRFFEKYSPYSEKYITTYSASCIDNNVKFFNYTLEELEYDKNTVLSSEKDIENWIKNLKFNFQGKVIYCNELDRQFNSIGEAATYLLNNNLYKSNSVNPTQSLTSAISKHLRKQSNYIKGVTQNYSFEYTNETTKQKGAVSGKVFVKQQVYCPEIAKYFVSQTEAAEYFVNEKIWDVCLKTARLRISEVCRKLLTHYKNYTFITID